MGGNRDRKMGCVLKHGFGLSHLGQLHSRSLDSAFWVRVRLMTLPQVCLPFDFYGKKDPPGFNKEFMPKGQMTTRSSIAC